MDVIRGHFVRDLPRARDAAPDLARRDNPTPTSNVNSGKITHVIEITHATEKLINAGLSVGDPQPNSSSSHLATKYIAVISVVVVVTVLALFVGGGLFWRRYRRRRAYKVVSHGADNKGKGITREKEDMFNADTQESERFNGDGGQKLTERNFESGYDKVDTGYEGTGYGGDEQHGDKRARLEPGNA